MSTQSFFNQSRCSYAKAPTVEVSKSASILETPHLADGTHRPAGRASTEANNKGKAEDIMLEWVDDAWIPHYVAPQKASFDCTERGQFEIEDRELRCFFSRRCMRDRYEFGKWPQRKFRTRFDGADNVVVIDWGSEVDKVIATRIAQKAKALRSRLMEMRWLRFAAGVRFLDQLKKPMAHRTERQKKIFRPTSWYDEDEMRVQGIIFADGEEVEKKARLDKIRVVILTTRDSGTNPVQAMNEFVVKMTNLSAKSRSKDRGPRNHEVGDSLGVRHAIKSYYKMRSTGDRVLFQCCARYTAEEEFVSEGNVHLDSLVEWSGWHVSKMLAKTDAYQRIREKLDFNYTYEDEMEFAELILKYYGHDLDALAGFRYVEDVSGTDHPTGIIFSYHDDFYCYGEPDGVHAERKRQCFRRAIELLREKFGDEPPKPRHLYNSGEDKVDGSVEWETMSTEDVDAFLEQAMRVQGVDMGAYVAATGSENFRLKLLEDGVLLFSQIMAARGNNISILLAGIGFLKAQAHNINRYLLKKWTPADVVELVVEAAAPLLSDPDEAKEKARDFCRSCGLDNTSTTEDDNVISNILNSFGGFVSSMVGKGSSDGQMKVEGFSFADAKCAVDSVDEAVHSETYRRMMRFFSYLMGCAMYCTSGEFTLGHFSVLDQWIKTSVWSNGANLMGDFIKLITWMCDKGFQCWNAGTLVPLWHSSERYGKFFQSTQRLRLEKDFLVNPEPHGFTIHDYDFRLNEALVESEIIMRRCVNMEEHEKSTVRRIQEELRKIKMELRGIRAASAPRRCPFGVLIYGQSKIGKSTIVDMVENYFALLMKLPIEPEYRFAVNPDANFWDGYQSWMWSIVLDDVAKVSLKTPEDKSLDAIINVINNISYMPDKARQEDKGMCPVKAELVTATTNTKDLNAWLRFSHPAAVLRRFNMVVTPIVKEEYANGSSLADTVRHDDPGSYPDWWLWTVETIEIHDGLLYYVAQCTKAPLDVFLRTMKCLVLKHRAAQDAFIQSRSAIGKVELCDRCLAPKQFCVCEPLMVEINLQSGGDGLEVEPPRVLAGPKPRPFSAGSGFSLPRLVSRVQNWMGKRDPARDKPPWDEIISSAMGEDVEGMEGVYGDELDDQGMVVQGTIMEVASNFPTCYTLADEAKGVLLVRWSPTLPIAQLVVSGLAMYGSYILYKKCVPSARDVVRDLRIRFNRLSNTGDLINDVITNAGQREAADFIRAVGDGYNTLEWWRDFGNRAARQVTVPRVLMAVASMCAGGLLLATLAGAFSKEKMRVEGDMAPPKPREFERPDVWYAAEYPTQKLEVSRETRCSSGSNVEGVMQKIGKQTLRVVCKFHWNGVDYQFPGQGLGICSQYILMSAHTIPVNDEFTMDVFDSKDGCTSNVKDIKMKQSQVYRHPTKDLAIIYTPNFRPMCDLRSFLAPKPDAEGLFPSVYLRREAKGDMTRITMHSTRIVRATHPAVECIKGYPNLFERRADVYWSGVYGYGDTRDGDCGAPLIIQSASGPVIGGIHNIRGPCMHDKDRAFGGFAAVLDRATIDDMIAKCVQQRSPMQCEGSFDRCHSVGPSLAPVKLEVGRTKFELGELHAKSPVRWIPDGTLAVYGSKLGFRSSYKSQVGATLFADYFHNIGVVCDKVKPDLGWRPYSRALTDMVHVPVCEDIDVINLCTDNLANDILSGLPEAEKEDFHPYDMDTAINGAEGVAYVNPINFNSSAGVPWYQSKREHLVQCGVNEQGAPKYTLGPEAMEMYTHMMARYDAGERACPIFGAKPKDEPLSEKKAAVGDTRIFEAGPIHLTIGMRQYYLPIIRMIQNNKFLFESGPGTVCQAAEWAEMFRYLVQHGADRILAGDYSKYDKRQGALWITEAFRVLLIIAKELGYSEKDLQRMRGMAYDVAYAFAEFDGTLVQFLGTNPSGHSLTVIINGLVGALYMRFCYFKLNPESEVKTFKQNVALMTYGDDNIAGVSPSTPWFNHTAIVGELAKIGVIYTMADKEAVSVPYIHISQATFLKRSFVEAEFTFLGEKTYVAPLEIKSLYKTMLVCTHSKVVTIESQSADMLRAIHMEFFFHGSKVFSYWDAHIRNVLDIYKLNNYVGVLPTWEGYVQRWQKASFALYPKLVHE